MTYLLNDADKTMIRFAAGDMPTAAVQALETAVAARLNDMLTRGEISGVTVPNVKTAISQEMLKGK